MAKMDKTFKISVVIPVYNTEEYLEETILSIVNQSIGFEKNIQLILVNNVTEDNSEEICKRYLEMYPDNVVYHKMDVNDGPCPARNAGMLLAKGKYINFLDSDDVWEQNAFKKACKFFDKHYDEIDLVSCRIRHFDASTRWHGLDWKFRFDGSSMMVDIETDFEYVQLHCGAVIFKTEAAKKCKFDERVRHAEDAKYITDVLLEKKKYALLKEAIFYYRTRSSGNSVLQTVQQSMRWYFDTPLMVYKYFFDISKQRYGYVLKYLQYLVMYELQFRFKIPLSPLLSPKEINDYKLIIRGLLEDIDDDVIWIQRSLKREFKIFALSMKYGESIKDKYEPYPDGSIYFNEVQLYEEYTSCVDVGAVDISNNSFLIEGRFWMVMPEQDWSLVVVCDEKEYDCEILYLNETEKRYSLGELIHEIKGFRVRVPINPDKTTSLSFVLNYKGIHVNLGISYAFICKLTNKMNNAYLHLKNYVVKPIEKQSIEIYPYSKKICRRFERKLEWELFFKRKKRVLAWRWLISLTDHMFKNRKPIWLFVDWFVSAGENAEYMFQYVMQKGNENIKAYYVISKDSKDYSRLKSIGPVIKADTKLYRLLFALSDKIISSTTFYNKNNTFREKTEFLQDMFKYDFVYLQHGVIKDNHADTQNKLKKNLTLFVTSAVKEQESLVKGIGGNYLYDESVVKVTGLARYDLIDDTNVGTEKRILVAPTWRKEGVGDWDEAAQTYKYSPLFKDTVFFKFYQDLITDERILNAMRNKGYKMALRLHPRTLQQVEDFSFTDDLVYVEKETNKYADEIRKTSLIITDYSSIAFDYAYAHIPVIYSHFDYDSFYSNHAYQRGYFDFQQDGFGEVVKDYESTVEAILKMIENDCKMEDKYRERVDSFFAYHDHNNRERIYNEILKLDEVKHSGS